MNERNIRALAVAAIAAAFVACSHSEGSPAPATARATPAREPVTDVVTAHEADAVDNGPGEMADDGSRVGPAHPLPTDPLAPLQATPALSPRTFAKTPPPRLPLPHDSLDHRTPVVGIEPAPRE